MSLAACNTLGIPSKLGLLLSNRCSGRDPSYTRPPASARIDLRAAVSFAQWPRAVQPLLIHVPCA